MALDEIDRKILELLRDNARRSATSMATHVGLTPGAIRRRIANLEEEGVIDHYTVVLDHDKVGPSVEAYVELSFSGSADVQAILERAISWPEVREASTLAGDPDALVRLRVDDADHLRDTVIKLRQMQHVTGSKTLFALGRMRHVSERQPSRRPSRGARSPKAVNR
jgi:Lrp/AsnC family leucine-responsive transcriptional regulator